MKLPTLARAICTQPTAVDANICKRLGSIVPPQTKLTPKTTYWYMQKTLEIPTQDSRGMLIWFREAGLFD